MPSPQTEIESAKATLSLSLISHAAPASQADPSSPLHHVILCSRDGIELDCYISGLLVCADPVTGMPFLMF
jgi:hypothetical protein